MSIERKFTMLSTREWIQYFQYKLSPEREKEIVENASKDPFLKEAIDAFSSQENRPIAHQSITYLISLVQENTGISESKVARESNPRPSMDAPSIQPRLIMMVLGGLLAAAAIGFGIYYFIQNREVSETLDAETYLPSDTSSVTATYADSSSRPFDVIPSATSTPVDTVRAVANPSTSATKPIRQTGNTTSTAANVAKTDMTVKSTNESSSKERDLFYQAQDQYNKGNVGEAKRILNDLKSYDNPMKEKAQDILKQMGN